MYQLIIAQLYKQLQLRAINEVQQFTLDLKYYSCNTIFHNVSFNDFPRTDKTRTKQNSLEAFNLIWYEPDPPLSGSSPEMSCWLT